MSGQHYAFVPFSKDELAKTMTNEPSVFAIAQTWRLDAQNFYGQTNGRKIPVIVRYGTTDAAKWKNDDFNSANDTIYIIGHCSAGSNTLNGSRGAFRFDRAELDPDTIVARLKDYIPTEMVRFKLLACNGGTFVTKVVDGIMDFEKSFAEKLYSKLKREYRAATLTAYCLPVKAGLDAQGHKQLTMADGGPGGGRPSSNKVVFGV
jgi:hypothetical protein